MSKSISINRINMKMGSTNIRIVILKQSDISIIVREELGHILIIDAVDCYEMYLLASLFKHTIESHDVIFMERGSDDHTDLFIFNGAVTPLTWKDLRKIKTSIKFSKSETSRLALLNSHDESIWDTWEHWKYEKQLRVQASKDIGIINSSQLGFERLVYSCSYLASSYTGHSHFDRNSTKSSIELIIRNIARNN